MRTARFSDPEPFLDRALPFLMEHEAANNLLIAVPMSGRSGGYWTVSDDGGAACGAAMFTPPFSSALSWPFPDEALSALAADVQDLPGILAPTETADRFLKVHGRSPAGLWRSRIYRLDRVQPPAQLPGRIARAEGKDRDMLLRWLAAFQEDVGDPIRQDVQTMVDETLQEQRLYLWRDEVPVSMAAWTRPTPNGACITMVYTPPDLRRRGYASALVAALSQRLLDEGKRFCCLFTDLANPTSNSIYQRIGYRPVLDLHHYRF